MLMARCEKKMQTHRGKSKLSHEIYRQKYTTDIIDSVDSLRKLQSEWDELASPESVEPWKSYNWVESAARACNEDCALRIITTRKKGRLTAVAPMVLKPTGQAWSPLVLQFLGGDELKEPNNFIAKDKASLEVLLEKLISEPVFPIRLSRIPNQYNLLNSTIKKLKRNGWYTAVMNMPYPSIDLSEMPLKNSLQSDIRRAKKKAYFFGKTTYYPVNGINKEELPSLIEQAFKIEGSGWKGDNHSAILSNPWRKKFFENLAYSSLQEGTLRLSFLLIDDKPVAVHYAIESMNSYWLLNIGYDESVRSCSPGNLLLEASINHALERGLVHYNLLGKEEPWTKRWTQKTQDCLCIAAYRPNLHGMKAMLSDLYFMLIKRRLNDHKAKSIKKKLRPQIPLFFQKDSTLYLRENR